MSYHSFMKWTLDDDLTEDVITEIVTGLKDQLVYCKTCGYDGYAKGAYFTSCTVDRFIWAIGQLLDKYPGKKITKEQVIDFEWPNEKSLTIVYRVLTVMDRLTQLERDTK